MPLALADLVGYRVNIQTEVPTVAGIKVEVRGIIPIGYLLVAFAYFELKFGLLNLNVVINSVIDTFIQGPHFFLSLGS